ncbi:UDP-3-O-(3-hydroxymyristoyl)glucosamine N-acyltransferase [Granulicella mallensis]|uniref:UDP-3-O-(3-hydroxymyristoyl) glucosamine N-acyltransferase n=1 Tax=Granulicella mallensis (strain ATCC BAA-1857 / DSM 23137 / MP5ACTX8) TaxID=682795 RepID=G8NVM4_GRAMM|nr:UDP-3-O-(3-hydroxymyristoyl)glucosamine N-acyltransferase [Granulicella mallensis]AEU37696.1 UDP-3-O-(3-hydroxymyristoyl) glucosamine N-acyltransferase [Granulicella mallensis MP5ACTX8]
MSAIRRTATEIAALLGVETASQAILSHVSEIEGAEAEALVFAQDETTLRAALASHAGLILARRGTLESDDIRVLWVRDPKYAFALVARELAVPDDSPLHHPAASIDASAILGERTRVGAGAVIEANVVIGADCNIGSRTTICKGATLGDRVVVQSGAVLGATGFGYVRNSGTGEYLLFPQQGRLVVEDDVEIGANTTIDRGALGETRIGRGAKIDNLVHIGHNCNIGRHVVIAAQVGISGSTTVGDGAVLAGQVGLGDHVNVGPGVILGGQGGIFPGKTVTGPGEMFAGTPAEPVKDYLKSLARVRRLK